MKIEKITDTNYKIYIYSKGEFESDDSDKVKSIIKGLQKRLKLSGFYKAIVSIKPFGLFIDLEKQEDSFYMNTLDLRIIYRDVDVFFKTKDYFILDKDDNIRYNDKFYYVLVEDCFDRLLEKVEFGDFVFGSDVARLWKNGVTL